MEKAPPIPPREGQRICVELIEELATIPGVAGVHIMAPGNEAAVPEVIARGEAPGAVAASSVVSRQIADADPSWRRSGRSRIEALTRCRERCGWRAGRRAPSPATLTPLGMHSSSSAASSSSSSGSSSPARIFSAMRPAVLPDRGLDLAGDVGIALEEGLGVLAALADALAVVGEPGAGFLDHAGLDAEVDELAHLARRPRRT